ncbi:hypothetical protein [Virgibacillus halodenitrificans]|uniref:hypothetical protein n=1 Tax=Virgibacillus halodenitrificans TaxID=1482 RepID=UPI000306435F|nr:hypothetical protein [Virgibacillus halodenitrificans]
MITLLSEENSNRQLKKEFFNLSPEEKQYFNLKEKEHEEMHKLNEKIKNDINLKLNNK